VVIRRATPEDAELLSELGARTFAETFADANRDDDMARYLAASFNPEQQTAELADVDSSFYIAETAGIAAGYAMLRCGESIEGVTNNKPIELVRLYVSREYLGHGVGAALMENCLAEARRKGFRTLWLGVWEHNQRAQKFYRQWNFRDVGTHVFHLGDDAQTDLVMERAVES
jgi:diamine N-acetyltransferase